MMVIALRGRMEWIRMTNGEPAEQQKPDVAGKVRAVLGPRVKRG